MDNAEISMSTGHSSNVYEGDYAIMECRDVNPLDPTDTDIFKGFVVWDEECCCWAIDDPDHGKIQLIDTRFTTVTVDGNRWENPELLAESQPKNGN